MPTLDGFFIRDRLARIGAMPSLRVKIRFEKHPVLGQALGRRVDLRDFFLLLKGAQAPIQMRSNINRRLRRLALFSACAALSMICGLGPTPWAADENRPLQNGQVHRTILVLGDSLAAGFGLEPDQAFPALLQRKIDTSGLNCSVVNAGVSGDTTASGLRRIDWLLKRRVDVLLVELGGNDGLRGIVPEATKTNLQNIIHRTQQKYPDVKIVIAGMQMPPNMGADYVERFSRIFPELSKENKAVLIPFLLEGVGGRDELNLPDGIHPTAAGQEIVAENVWKVLKPLLSKAKPEESKQ